MEKLTKWVWCICLIATGPAHGQAKVPLGDFKKTVLTNEFISEGAAVADLNKDGKPDIIAGYHWFEAPNWKRHLFEPSRVYDPATEYSNSFLNLGMDVNLDGWDDVVIIDFPGKPAFWFENPKSEAGEWKKHIIADAMGVSNESPGFIDIDRDGRLDILCADRDKKQIVWLKAPVKAGETKWTRFALSRENVPGTENFSHGIGFGDIDMDGQGDVVIRDGWFKGTENLSGGDWEFFPVSLGGTCSHMQVFDVNADGKNDVISASAHGMGVWWHEQLRDNQNHVLFAANLISKTTSQTHSSIMADLDGDGKPEFVTGKRFKAHHGHDPGDADIAYIMWFKLSRGKAPYFTEHLIDNDSGAGLNIVVQDVNGDKKPDIVVANKKGVFLFENRMRKK